MTRRLRFEVQYSEEIESALASMQDSTTSHQAGELIEEASQEEHQRELDDRFQMIWGALAGLVGSLLFTVVMGALDFVIFFVMGIVGALLSLVFLIIGVVGALVVSPVSSSTRAGRRNMEGGAKEDLIGFRLTMFGLYSGLTPLPSHLAHLDGNWWRLLIADSGHSLAPSLITCLADADARSALESRSREHLKLVASACWERKSASCSICGDKQADGRWMKKDWGRIIQKPDWMRHDTLVACDHCGLTACFDDFADAPCEPRKLRRHKDRFQKALFQSPYVSGEAELSMELPLGQCSASVQPDSTREGLYWLDVEVPCRPRIDIAVGAGSESCPGVILTLRSLVAKGQDGWVLLSLEPGDLVEDVGQEDNVPAQVPE